MVKSNRIKIETTQWIKQKYCIRCQYSDKTSGNCNLIDEVSIEVFSKLLLAPCNISKLIKISALKLAAPVSNYLGDDEYIAEELTQEALLALVKKFQNKDFQYHGPDRTIIDILKFGSTVMRNYLSNMGTIKKVQGRYCVYFKDGCTLNTYIARHGNNVGEMLTFPYYGSKKCRETNPRLLKPSCEYFTSPQVDSIYSNEFGNAEDPGNEKISLIDTIQSPGDEVDQKILEWKSLIKTLWRRAESVPEMRCLIRLVKYQTLLDNSQHVNNIVKIAAASGIDPSTINKDLETLDKWRRQYE